VRRFHSPREREIMMRRWRMEIQKHEGFRQDKTLPSIPPAPDEDSCHCYRGMGFLRKRRPYDCGNPRCGACHYEKFWMPRARQNARRAAIAFEEAAT
jgi:hypothetical protein